MALLISDPATMGLSISDFTTIALGLAPQCALQRSAGGRAAAGGWAAVAAAPQ